MFTSGTSGRPKGALLAFQLLSGAHERRVHRCRDLHDQYGGNEQAAGQPHAAKTLLAVPLFHISGLLSQALINLRHGRALHDVQVGYSRALRIVKEEQIIALMGAPVMLLELLKNQAFSDEHAAHLTNVSAGGAATPDSSPSSMPPKPDGHVRWRWGMTETMGPGAAFTGRYFAERPTASGFLSPIVEFSFRRKR